MTNRTLEFRRISEAPRHAPLDGSDIVALSEYLYVPGYQGDARLNPSQAAGLVQASEHPGGCYPLTVGGGKFLLSVLIPTVRECRRPLLIVPANLLKQTRAEIEKWGKVFRIHPDLQVTTYSKLSGTKGLETLNRLRADLIVCDEAHTLQNRKSARTKAFARYLSDKEIPIFLLSGTILEKSLIELYSLLKFTHRHLGPLPRTLTECTTWADAVDLEPPRYRRPIGAFRDWLLPEDLAEKDPVAQARKALRNRISTYPGIVCSPEWDDCNASLTIEAITIPMPKSVREDFRILRDTGQTPGGERMCSGVDIARHARELAAGFYYKWDPPPPEHWLLARADWRQFCKEVIDREDPRYLSPKQVALGVQRGELPTEAYSEWQAVRKDYTIESIPVWRDPFAIDFAERWAKKNGGIVWVHHRAVGAAFTKIPYFGPGEAGDGIREHRGPCAASLSHSVGKNLQQFSKALVLTPPTTAKGVGQLLGRHHRKGQLADEVHFSILTNCKETYNALRQAKEKADFGAETLVPSHKLRVGQLVISEEIQELAENSRLPEWG